MTSKPDLILNSYHFIKKSHNQMMQEKHLGIEGAKLGFAVVIIASSLAALVLVPHFFQNNSWSQFLEGLKEAKWALISGVVAGVTLSLIGALILWQKNKEDKDRYVQESLLKINPLDLSKNDRTQITKIKDDLKIRFKNLSLVIAFFAITVFATSLLVAFNDGLITKISLTDFILGSSVTFGIVSLAYMIFKSYEIHQIRKIRSLL